MLVVRLSRRGRKKYPTYRIVVAESRRAATGKFVALLGNYNPHTKDLVINTEEALRYINNGAQPSNSVIRLLQGQKVELPSWVKYQTAPVRPKKNAEEEPVVEAKADSAPESDDVAEPEAVEQTADSSDEVSATGAEEPAESVGAEVAGDAKQEAEESAPEPAKTDSINETATDVEAEQAATEAVEEAAAAAAIDTPAE